MAKRSKSAFTLIELLVVVAIIALLVSMLLPTLGRAKMITRRVYCKNNLHDAYIGIRMYLNDNDEYMPLALQMGSVPEFLPAPPPPAVAPNPPLPMPSFPDMMAKYIANPKNLRCPSDTQLNFYKTDGMSYYYDYFDRVRGRKVDALFLAQAAKRSGSVRIMVLHDSRPFHNPTGTLPSVSLGTDEYDVAGAQQGGAGWANFLFIDGHVGDLE